MGAAEAVERIECSRRPYVVTQLLDDGREQIRVVSDDAQQVDPFARVVARGAVERKVGERLRQAHPVGGGGICREFVELVARASHVGVVLVPPLAVVVLGGGGDDGLEQVSCPAVTGYETLYLPLGEVIGGGDGLLEGKLARVPDEQSEELLTNDAVQLLGPEADEHARAVDRRLCPEGRARALTHGQGVAVPGDARVLAAEVRHDPVDLRRTPGSPREPQRSLKRITCAQEHSVQPDSRVTTRIDLL